LGRLALMCIFGLFTVRTVIQVLSLKNPVFRKTVSSGYY